MFDAILPGFGAPSAELIRPIFLDAVGFVAGAMVACSGIPKVLQRMRAVRAGTSRFDEADLWRDGAQAIGNLLWVLVGFSLGLISITFFCSVQACLMGSLIYMNLQSRTRADATDVASARLGTPAQASLYPY
jgi:hypothetical protein